MVSIQMIKSFRPVNQLLSGSNVSYLKTKRHLHSKSLQILSGIQPTGNIHLGNYFGAINQWVKYQDGLRSNQEFLTQLNDNGSMYDQFLPPIYQIVDMHSITTSHDSNRLRDNIFDITAVLLGCGIDPEKCILFKQSSVPLNGYLCWILATISTMPQLSRFPQFKEKSAGYKDVPLGLYLYPVLQVADILLYKGTHVPIGDDQLPHINLAKHMTSKFNNTFKCKIFPIPNEILPKSGAGRVKSLRAPEKKMSKSEADTKSRIEMTDTSDEIIRKIRKSVTDMTSAVTYSPADRPGVSNLIQIYSSVTNLSIEEVVVKFDGKETFQFKQELGDILAEYIRPIRERINQLSNDRHYLEMVLMDGATKAQTIAEDTISQVQQVIGSDMANLIGSNVPKVKYIRDRTN
ncbi:Tryptophan--tRNA ligase, mitochondrial [Blomia tropicalis]|nr:Tryptophan--tRNA ligase, mitochondrial [Blomia tropicalis]